MSNVPTQPGFYHERQSGKYYKPAGGTGRWEQYNKNYEYDGTIDSLPPGDYVPLTPAATDAEARESVNIRDKIVRLDSLKGQESGWYLCNIKGSSALEMAWWDGDEMYLECNKPKLLNSQVEGFRPMIEIALIDLLPEVQELRKSADRLTALQETIKRQDAEITSLRLQNLADDSDYPAMPEPKIVVRYQCVTPEELEGMQETIKRLEPMGEVVRRTISRRVTPTPRRRK